MKNNRLLNARLAQKKIQQAKKFVKKFTSALKVLDWKNLNCTKKQNGGTDNYAIRLPNEFYQDFDALLEFIEPQSEYKEIFHHIIYGHPEDALNGIEWSIQIIPQDMNRIHINGDGIPYSLRQLGLGKKIYKRIIKEVGFISTQDDKSYKYSHLLWLSLTKDEEVYCFISPNLIIATLKNSIPSNFFLILKTAFKNIPPRDCKFEKVFCEKYSDKLIEHQLKNYCPSPKPMI
jgi:hypothetical protein